MKNFMMKTVFTLALAIAVLYTANIPVAAHEASITSATQSCIECGNTGFYRTVEYGDWEFFLKEECVHGTHLYDVTYVRKIFEVTRCTYCHHLEAQDYIRLEDKTECSNS